MAHYSEVYAKEELDKLEEFKREINEKLEVMSSEELHYIYKIVRNFEAVINAIKFFKIFLK